MAQAAPALSDPGAPPFTTFRFLVEISVPGVSQRVAGATFSEVDGLEMSIEPKTLREGGRNGGPVHLAGPVSYGQLTLKRGMTAGLDLWKWFAKVGSDGWRGVRTTAEVVVLSSDGLRVDARFVLRGCLPVKLKAPALNAMSGQVAIEEMQLVYETMKLREADDAAEGGPT